jgi:hypothetical protein
MMSTSDRTINQVRAILNKLDRSIDEARERRTQPSMPAAHQPPQATPTPAPQQQPAAPSSAYGRAQPLQRPQAATALRWPN